MTKSELINKVTEKMPRNCKKDSTVILDTIFDSMTKSLAEGERVEIRGFGSFNLRKRRARQGRNPKTGALVHVESKVVPFFKASKNLKKLVDESTVATESRQPIAATKE